MLSGARSASAAWSHVWHGRPDGRFQSFGVFKNCWNWSDRWAWQSSATLGFSAQDDTQTRRKVHFGRCAECRPTPASASSELLTLVDVLIPETLHIEMLTTLQCYQHCLHPACKNCFCSGDWQFPLNWPSIIVVLKSIIFIFCPTQKIFMYMYIRFTNVKTWLGFLLGQ